MRTSIVVNKMASASPKTASQLDAKRFADYVSSQGDYQVISSEVEIDFPLLLREAVAEARGDYIVLTDGSKAFVEDWDRKILDIFFENQKVAWVISEGGEAIVVHKQFLNLVSKVPIPDYSALISSLKNASEKMGAEYKTFPFTEGTIPIPNEPAELQPPIDIDGDKNSPLIYIGIPSETGEIQRSLVMDLLVWTHDPSMRVVVRMPERHHPLTSARNFIVKDFLASDCDYLFWVDDDVVPPANALRRLLSREKQIIGGVCYSFRRNDNGKGMLPYPIVLRRNEENLFAITDTRAEGDLSEVDAMGGGCCLVKREVYENTSAPWYEFSFDEYGILSQSGDFNFYTKAKESGYKIFVDNTIHADHVTKCSIIGLFDSMEPPME